MSLIHEALNLVKRDLGAVSKGGTMRGGSFSYKYRSIDDVLNKLHPILVEHGVVGPVPKLVSYESTGKKVIANYEYTFFALDGSSLSGGAIGEGDDPGDKRANKASTAALKTFLAQALAIPFETDDPDDYPSSPSSEEDRPKAASGSSTSGAKPTSGGGSDSPQTPAASGTRAPNGPAERKCETCTYVIGAGDPIKRKAGKTYHKQCFEDKDQAPAASAPDADDISSIIDAFPGATEA